jgi:hypothetical protein
MVSSTAMGEALRFEAHLASTTLQTERLACWVTLLHITAGIACGQSFLCSRLIGIVVLLAACIQLLVARMSFKVYMKHRVTLLLFIRVATFAAALGVQSQVESVAPGGIGSSFLTSTQHTLQLVQLSGLLHILLCHGMTILPFWYSAAIQTTYLAVLVKSSRAVAGTIMSSPSSITWLRSAHRSLQYLLSIAELSTFPFSSMIKPLDQLDYGSLTIIIVLFTQGFVGLVLPLYVHFCWEWRMKLLLSWQAHHLSDQATAFSQYQRHRCAYQRRHVLAATLLGLNDDALYHATILCHAVIIVCLFSGSWVAATVVAPMLGPCCYR